MGVGGSCCDPPGVHLFFTFPSIPCVSIRAESLGSASECGRAPYNLFPGFTLINVFMIAPFFLLLPSSDLGSRLVPGCAFHHSARASPARQSVGTSLVKRDILRRNSLAIGFSPPHLPTSACRYFHPRDRKGPRREPCPVGARCSARQPRSCVQGWAALAGAPEE